MSQMPGEYPGRREFELKFRNDRYITSPTVIKTGYDTRQFLCYMFLFSISFVHWP